MLAERLADVALAEIYGQRRRWQAPEPVAVRRRSDTEVEITFEPIENWINDYGLPAARCPIDIEDAVGFPTIIDWRVEEHSCVLRVDRPIGASAVVHGMWRMDHGGLIPADCMRMPFLSFYGVPIP